MQAAGFKCPICSKSVASDEMEMHFIMCLSKPRLSYNGKGQAVWGTRCPAILGGSGWLKSPLLRAGGLAGLPKGAVLWQDGHLAIPAVPPLPVPPAPPGVLG
ncbi:hypothetical protein EK904_006128 [Melospiza melodia maxima]|nr:hypothetical protein EK904_006128 [Melospiza melodia maxima]